MGDAGHFLGPICITNTHSVGISHLAAVKWMIRHYKQAFADQHPWAMGHAGHLAADLQNKQRRSAELAIPDLDPHRSRLAGSGNRGAYALELQA